MKLFLNFVLLITIHICKNENPAEITYITADQVKTLGDDVDLKCMVHNPNLLTVIWSKTDHNDQTILTVNNIMLIPEIRYSISRKNGEHILKIKNIQLSDVGIYECMMVKSIVHKITKTVNLFIAGPPIIKNNRTSSEITTRENNNVELFCDAHGYPTPEVKWTREGDVSGFPVNTTFDERNKRLILNSMSKYHRGKYYCTAKNSYGEHRKSFLVKVEFSPVIYSNMAEITSAIGDELSLTCKIEAYPRPKIDWYDTNNTLLENGNADYIISNVEVGNDVVLSELYIPKLTKNNSGEYYCSATNGLGFMKSHTNLTVMDINWFGKLKRFLKNIF